MSKQWKAKFFIPCDTIFLVRPQGKCENGRSWGWKVNKPWPNGTPNSRKLSQSYKIKTCIGGWPNGTAKSSQLARIPSTCLTTTARSLTNLTKQLGESWLKFVEVAKWWKTWLELGVHLSFIKFKPTRAKWVDKWYPTWTRLETWLKLAWVRSTVWPGLQTSKERAHTGTPVRFK